MTPWSYNVTQCWRTVLIKGNTKSNRNGCSSFITFSRNTNLISLINIKYRNLLGTVELKHILTAHTDASTYFSYFYSSISFFFLFFLLQYCTSLSSRFLKLNNVAEIDLNYCRWYFKRSSCLKFRNSTKFR